MISRLSAADSNVAGGLRRRRRGLSLLCVPLAGVLLLPLTGCGPRRLRADFSNFEQAFATTSNREVLLNLARLQNRDPTYFFKLGQITSSYRMQATLAGSGNYVIQGTGTAGNATGGGAPGLLYENDPSFTFIPVNDETNAQLLLRPVPAETFYILYQQGWRLDQLFRLLVDRIEYTQPTATGCRVMTLHNVPPPLHGDATGTPDARYLKSQEALSGYVTFLRVTALMYALQKHGHLLLKGQDTFVPYDSKSFVPGDGGAKSDLAKAGGPAGKPAGPEGKPGERPALKDILDANAKNASWELVGDKWMLGRTVFSPVFYLNPLLADPANKGSYKPDLATIQSDITDDGSFNELTRGGDSLRQVLYLLGNGFSIEGAPSPQQEAVGPCAEPPHLYLRSLLGLMAASAQEETSFENLLKYNPRRERAKGDPAEWEVLSFTEAVPAIERLPAIRIRRVPEDKGSAPLIQVTYEGSNYLIADVNNPEIPENQYWNRDMFRLINLLTSQVTVDISKFPLPDILQLHQ